MTAKDHCPLVSLLIKNMRSLDLEKKIICQRFLVGYCRVNPLNHRLSS